MRFNVATLLQEPVGSRRRERFDDEPVQVAEAGWSGRASGEVRLLRSGRGVLVEARLTTAPIMDCARCLEPFRQELTLTIAEEFIAPIDLVTGEPVEQIDEDEFRVDELHHLDLSEAVRQYEQTAIPLQPICRPDCVGLCPVCGQNRNEAGCECVPDGGAGSWEALAALRERLHVEESRGVTEA